MITLHYYTRAREHRALDVPLAEVNSARLMLDIIGATIVGMTAQPNGFVTYPYTIDRRPERTDS